MKNTLILLALFVAIQPFTTLHAQNPESTGIQWWGEDEVANDLVSRGLDHLLNIEREMAFTYFDAAVQKDPSLFAPRVVLSWMSDGDTRAYHKIQAQKLVSDKNEASKLYVSLMEAGSGQEGAEKRRAIWAKMHELAPNGPFIHNNYARSRQDPKEQIAEYEKLLINNTKNDRNSDYVHNTLGYLYYAEGDKAKAKMHFDKYLELRPNGYNAYDSMAEFYRREGDLKNALVYYKKAKEKYPAAISATNNIKEIESELSAEGNLWLQSAESFAQNLPEVFSSIPIKVKEGHSPPEVTNYVKAMNRGLSEFGRGIGAWISYGDRGERAQQLVWGFSFDFKESRDYYFPKADDNSEGANPQFDALGQRMAAAGLNLNQDLTEAEPYTDWVCIGFDNLVNPQLGGLVAVRTIPIKAGSEAAFEKYVTDELYPAYQKNTPGFDAYVFKGDRGQGKGAYLMLWSFQSVDQRNSFFPTPEGESTEAFNKAYANISAVMDKMSQFTDSTVQSTSYTDYISIDVKN